MLTEVKKWGNSLAVRLKKEETERLGIKEGDRVKIRIEKKIPEDKIDLSDIPTGFDPDPRASERHDKYLYEER